MMELCKTASGTQWRAYCPACNVGLNWYTDPAGTAAAERFTANHNTRHVQPRNPAAVRLKGKDNGNHYRF